MNEPGPSQALPSERERVGTKMGRYLLIDVLGRGGMGVVYRATTPENDEVAVKLMLPDLTASADYRERFIREAEFGPRLRHPHIVEVVDVGEDGNELFMAMSLVPGPDLKAVINDRGRLSRPLTVALLEQAAAGLDFAHQCGVVHLDVKPQNILLESAPTGDAAPPTYVTDFGLLRPSASEQTTTRSGQIYGSIAYISPEQIENLEVDGRADVYALGCVAYECLTGEVPFDRPNEVAVLWAHVHEEPPRMSVVRRDLPVAMDGVLFSALAKRPEDRFLTCGDFVEELATASSRKRSRMYPILRPLVARTPRQRQASEVWAPNFFPELARVRAASERPNWAAVGIMGSMLAGILAIQIMWEGGVPRAVSDTAKAVAQLVPPVVETLTEDEDEPRTTSRRKPKPSLPPPPVTAPRGLRNPEGARGHLAGSAREPNEQGRGTSTSRREPSAPTTTSVGLLSFTRDMDVAPNGRRDHVFMMNSDGSNERSLGDALGTNTTPTTSPDGKRIAYESDRQRSLDIYAIAIDGTEPRRITPRDGLLYGFPHWSPDGKNIVMVATDSWSRSEYSIRIVHVATGRMRTLASGFDPSWSPDGRKIAFTNGTGDIYVINANGSGLTRLTSTDNVREWRPTWSPDGRSLVFDAMTETFDSDLFTIDLRTGERRALTSTPGRLEFRPCWLSDGSAIAVDALDVASGNEDIWLISPDGESATNLTRSVTDEYYVDCGW